MACVLQSSFVQFHCNTHNNNSNSSHFMDKSIKRGLSDRIYEKRKATALELESIVSNAISNNDTDQINQIIKQLRNEFAYNINDPLSRYGGLIGLAAISIAMGPNELPKYLNIIIHPVIACFGDNDPNVRYYACEALYNITKVAKGEILLYFNEIFDILCKLVADVENNVKNAADILDRLIKDLVCDKSTNYVSVLNTNVNNVTTIPNSSTQHYEIQSTKAFSLPKFIPLLKERIYATNTYTRLFIVSWLILLDSIPDLELISYLPSFFDPLLSYLKSPLKDVRIITENFLKLLLQEIKKINEIKLLGNSNNDNYIYGQDISIDYSKIIDILVNNLESNDSLIKSICLDWLISLLSISPQSFILLIPKLLIILLNIISLNDGNSNDSLQQYALQLNSNLMYLVSNDDNRFDINYNLLINNLSLELLSNYQNNNNNNSNNNNNNNSNNNNNNNNNNPAVVENSINDIIKLNSLDWLIMLQNKDPIKFMDFNDNIFLTLLKSLNDSNEKIINKVLNLLSRILNQSNDKYFNNFIIDLLNLFKNDSKFLNSKSDFIIKKICKNLSSERVYKSLSDNLLKIFNDENNEISLNFISIMIQILNNNLIIAPELLQLRKNLINKSAALFENLFKCWSLNSPSLLCLTLLTSKYELSYKIINKMVKYEISINTLIQLDLLIQLLETPVFAKLRLDLLDPVSNIYLFKCLYGLLMLLPQSNSFKILQNRLNSISSITNLPLNTNDNNNNNNNNNPCENHTILSIEYNNKLLDYFIQIQENIQNLKLNNINNDNDNDNIDDNHVHDKYNEMFQNDYPLDTSSINNP